jgi:hypothetical protein
VPSGIWLQVDGTTSYNLGVPGNSTDTYFGTYFKFWTDSDKTQFYVSSLDASAVPEPATMLLFGAGLAGLAGYSRKKRDQGQVAVKA